MKPNDFQKIMAKKKGGGELPSYSLVAGFKNDDFFKGQKNHTQKSDSCGILSPKRQIFGRFLNRPYFCL